MRGRLDHSALYEIVDPAPSGPADASQSGSSW